MQVDLSTLAPWGALVLSIASFWYSIASSRSKENDEKIASMSKWIESKASKDHVEVLHEKLDLVENKVAVIENDLTHLPAKETTHRLELSISEMRTEMRGLTERMKPIAAMAERVQEAVLEKVMS